MKKMNTHHLPVNVSCDMAVLCQINYRLLDVLCKTYSYKYKLDYISELFIENVIIICYIL